MLLLTVPADCLATAIFVKLRIAAHVRLTTNVQAISVLLMEILCSLVRHSREYSKFRRHLHHVVTFKDLESNTAVQEDTTIGEGNSMLQLILTSTYKRLLDYCVDMRPGILHTYQMAQQLVALRHKESKPAPMRLSVPRRTPVGLCVPSTQQMATPSHVTSSFPKRILYSTHAVRVGGSQQLLVRPIRHLQSKQTLFEPGSRIMRLPQ